MNKSFIFFLFSLPFFIGAGYEDDRREIYSLYQQLSFLFSNYDSSKTLLSEPDLSALAEWLHEVYSKNPESFLRVLRANHLSFNDCVYALSVDQGKVNILSGGIYFLVLGQNAVKYLLFWLSKRSLTSAREKLFKWHFSDALSSTTASGYLALKGFGKVREIRQSQRIKQLFDERKKNNENMLYALQRERIQFMVGDAKNM